MIGWIVILSFGIVVVIFVIVKAKNWIIKKFKQLSKRNKNKKENIVKMDCVTENVELTQILEESNLESLKRNLN